jgi:hypothetical protein
VITVIKRRVLAAGSIVLFVIAAVMSLPALAQRRGGMGQITMYDTTTETTLKGTVEEVKTVSGMLGGGGRMAPGGRTGAQGMAMMQGIHVTLKTDAETLEVHLGPSAFLKDQKIEIAKGDALEIVGSRVKIGESEALIAREVRKGQTSWTLRDANGRPRWAMMGRW